MLLLLQDEGSSDTPGRRGLLVGPVGPQQVDEVLSLIPQHDRHPD
ncbi:hypothetical protein [Micromonospora sp. MH33]|nr:hypothetical protein [Micromonospora sp. MH33]